MGGLFQSSQGPGTSNISKPGQANIQPDTVDLTMEAETGVLKRKSDNKMTSPESMEMGTKKKRCTETVNPSNPVTQRQQSSHQSPNLAVTTTSNKSSKTVNGGSSRVAKQ